MTIYEIEDICNLLKIGKSTAYELVRKKELQAFQIHGIWQITVMSLSLYISGLTNGQEGPCDIES